MPKPLERTPPPLCQLKAVPECEVVGGMFVYPQGKGQKVRACVACAATAFPTRRPDHWGGVDGETYLSAKAEAVPDLEQDRIEHLLGRVTELEAEARRLRRQLTIADGLVALYDAAMYDEGDARLRADALLGQYEQLQRVLPPKGAPLPAEPVALPEGEVTDATPACAPPALVAFA